MKKLAFAIGWLSLVIVGIAEAQLGRGRLDGRVVDADGPVAGATIVAESERAGGRVEATADDNGKFMVTGLQSGDWEFTVSAEGYVPEMHEIRISELNQNDLLNVTLEKIPTEVARGGDINVLLNAANAAYEQENLEDALAKYQEVLEIDPSLYVVRTNLGHVYREMGDLDQAFAEYAMVLEEEPTNRLALQGAGDVLVDKGEPQEAVVYFEKVMIQAPDDETLPFDVGEMYFNTGNSEQAIVFYDKAVAIKPDWSRPYLKMAYAYLNLGKLDDAAAQFQKVVEVAPDSEEGQLAQGALDSLK